MNDVSQIAQLLGDTLCSDGNVVRSATVALDRISLTSHFPFSLLSIATESKDQGQKIAAATYLKNHTRRSIESDGTCSIVSKEFKDQLLKAMVQVESPILKILVEVFRVIVVAEFVKNDVWPELILDLRSAIENSNLISMNANSKCSTINALIVLRALLRPFQYFLDPKVAKEPVPTQLELISKEILVPLLTVFHQFVEKALATSNTPEMDTEKVHLVVCKCIHFAVKSHMPSTLAPHMDLFCRDLIGILNSLALDHAITLEDAYGIRLKTGKRSLLIFCALITRHRKYSDKLMPEMMKCVLNLVKFSKNIYKLDFLSERILSLGFDVISHVLETGPGWKLVSPHFMTLLESAIFPALAMNEKDISEWEEDADEYLRKNLPSDIDEISGWKDDLLTARKSAVNLLGVISMSKGPPTSNGSSASSKRKKSEKNRMSNKCSSMGELLVLPFLSKFQLPLDANASETTIINDYFGSLMAYGGLQDFLREQEPSYVTKLVSMRVLPLYSISLSVPYLVACANWILGELGSILPEEMSADVYSQLLKALVMPDKGDISCYPVRVSAAGAIATLLENDYMPPEWLPLLQAVISNIGNEDMESSILFQLLSSVAEAGNGHIASHIPYIVSSLVSVISRLMTPNLKTWPQVIEKGIAALAVMALTWEESRPEEAEKNESLEKWVFGQDAICRAFAALLQQAWLTPICAQESKLSPPSSCVEDMSTMLRFIIVFVKGNDAIQDLKVSQLVSVWADLIAEWHAWEESEDLSIFYCIKEIVNVHSTYGINNFLVKQIPSPPAPPVPQRSIIESIGAFVSKAILQYPSAARRACSCVHILLHKSIYSIETEDVKQSLVVAFSRAAISRFREVHSEPCSLWKPLMLATASCYLCYPDIFVGMLEKGEVGAFTSWASALCYVCNSSFEPGLIAESEMKLIVMALTQVVEQQLRQGNPFGGLLQDCFSSLLEVSIRLKEVLEGKNRDGQETEESENDYDENDENSEDSEEDSDSEEYEETEEEFLDRYARAAAELENGSLVEMGDEEDMDDDIELGRLMEIDQQRALSSLIEKYRHVLMQGNSISLQLVMSFVNAFPEYGVFFHQWG